MACSRRVPRSTTRSNESSVLVFRFPVDASMVIIIVRIKLYYQPIRIVQRSNLSFAIFFFNIFLPPTLISNKRSIKFFSFFFIFSREKNENNLNDFKTHFNRVEIFEYLNMFGKYRKWTEEEIF